MKSNALLRVVGQLNFFCSFVLATSSCLIWLFRDSVQLVVSIVGVASVISAVVILYLTMIANQEIKAGIALFNRIRRELWRITCVEQVELGLGMFGCFIQVEDGDWSVIAVEFGKCLVFEDLSRRVGSFEANGCLQSS